jgi:hypothetical protein
MKTPDVTPIQYLGASALILLGSAYGLLSAFGHPLTGEQTIAITGAATAFTTVAVAADAVIRSGRAKIAAAAKAAKVPTKTAARSR